MENRMNDNRFKRIFEGSELCSSDWPLSLGYRIHLVTDVPTARNGFRKTVSLIDELLAAQKRDYSGSSGVAVDYGDAKVYLIIIRASESGVAVFPGRLIELVAHECSHIVDYAFSNASIVGCTETRAYMLDWLVGKTVNAVLPHLWEPLALPAP